MAARLAAIAAIAAVAASCATGSGEGGLATLATVDGRGLQPAWWSALPNLDEPGEETAPVPPEPLTLPADALFDVGQATVRPDDIAQLNAFAEALAAREGQAGDTWTVVGGTDTTGNGHYQLGFDRAQAVINALGAVPGLARTRFVAASWGETCPAIDETTAPDLAQARAQNRRVVVVPPGATPPCPVPD